VAGIDGDDEITGCSLFRLGNGTRRLHRIRLVAPGLGLHKLGEFLLVDHLGVENEPVTIAALIRLHLGKGELDRACRRQHDAGAAFIHGAITDVLEEAARLEIFGRKAESGCRQVDDDALRIGNIMDGKTGLAVEIDDDAGSGIVANDTRSVGQQGILRVGGTSRNRAKHCEAEKPRCKTQFSPCGQLRRDPKPLKQ